ncbi:hypothetical protein [Streptomyces sp. NBC_00842]|uniref:hypothetical protein n=1 Tax=Streptomyces sp. NBC_00842 TaxID=2975848 RepID=UPI00386F0603|nr:hypothetical protein OH821_22165 [Streptomyces sp. NBC_00842]
MSEYMIRYSIIPPGVGPDDYEPGDLEQREELVEVPGEEPSVATIHATVQALLPPGSGVAILQVRRPGEES